MEPIGLLRTMKLKIKCNGSPQSAVVVDAATDRVVENVLGVEISLNPFNVEAAIVIKDIELDLEGIEAEVIDDIDTSWDDGGTGTPDD
tara:strand:- start:13 stop:276 length:264 start_codon:yes stop_codon:yes gene_type:complete